MLAALLFQAGRQVSTETLIDRVWGAARPPEVRNALYSYVTRLRRALRRTGVELRRTDNGYLLAVSPAAVDLHRFTRLATGSASQLDRAIAEWRGEPLDGLSGAWAEQVRTGLHHRYARLLVDWADRELAAKNPARVVDRLGPALDEYPHAESLLVRFLRALHGQGRTAEALECYEASRLRLRGDLGAQPGTPLRELHLELLRSAVARPERTTRVPAAGRSLVLGPLCQDDAASQLAQRLGYDSVSADGAGARTGAPPGRDTRVRADLEFRLLGRVELFVRGTAVDLGPAKQRCVLAVLLHAAGGRVSTGTLIDRVWGSAPPGGARGTLYSYLTRLRKALRGTGTDVRRQSGGYLVDVPADRLDLLRMGALAEAANTAEARNRARLLGEALDLWRGDPLETLAGDWVTRVRAGLHRQRLALLTEWAALRLAEDAPEDVVARLRPAVTAYPLAEALGAHLMRALHAAGHTAEAHERYRRTARRMADELGAEPGHVLRAAHAAIAPPLGSTHRPHVAGPIARRARLPAASRNPVQ
ncbi:hypothetical protein GCM10009754_27710 [Amycolatopsis minnesotensis]|uniref:OmpR/PhoB-type domain-containing protein n=1 Tax=Amycolatopsis minnesotensis TaxID=337894 RepID=A0ABN2QPW6_9PSEU